MFHVMKSNATKLRTPAIAILFIVFSLVSWNYMSRFYYVGSYESAISLSKRPAIIDWDKFSKSDPSIPSQFVVADSFLNFDAQATGLRKEPNLFPSTYYKGKESIFPLYMRPKNGGLPLYINRKMSEWFSPEVARPLFNWLMCILAFAFSCFYISRNSGSTIPFMFFALVTPQIFFLNNSNFPSATLTFALMLAIIYWVERAEKKIGFFCIGLLCALCFFCKLSTLLIFPPLLLFYGKKIWQNKFVLLAGLIPWLLVTLIAVDFVHFVTKVLDERRGDISYFSAVIQSMVQIVSPDLQFRHVMYIMKPVSEVIQNSLWWFWLSAITALTFVVILFRNCVPRNLGWKLAVVFIWQFIVFLKLAPVIRGELIAYFDRAFYLAVVLLAARMMKPNKLVTISFIVFLLFRGGVAFNWNQEFNQYTKSLNGCSWVYECLYRDWDNGKMLEGKPLVTLNYLDIGQLEFLSREKLIPLHVHSRLTRIPSQEELLKFFISIPSKEFFILASGKPDGKSLEHYMQQQTMEGIFKALGFKIELVKVSDFPELLKSYSLLKVTKI